jgi:hypothetical protein
LFVSLPMAQRRRTNADAGLIHDMGWLCKPVDLRAIAETELAKSQEIFEAYFSNKNFQ